MPWTSKHLGNSVAMPSSSVQEIQTSKRFSSSSFRSSIITSTCKGTTSTTFYYQFLETKAMQYTYSFPTKAPRTAGSQWHFRRSPSSSSRIGEVTYDGHVTYVSFCVFHPFLSLPQAARGWYYRDERWHRRNQRWWRGERRGNQVSANLRSVSCFTEQ